MGLACVRMVGVPGSTLMPTSMTIAPGLIHSFLISLGWRTATTRMSASETSLTRSRVFEWHIVTVASWYRSRSDIGAPCEGVRV